MLTGPLLPSQLAALALADRVSEERNSKVGREIGYHVRFDAKLPEDNGSISESSHWNIEVAHVPED